MKHTYVIYIEKKPLTDMNKKSKLSSRKLGICVYCRTESHLNSYDDLFVCVRLFGIKLFKKKKYQCHIVKFEFTGRVYIQNLQHATSNLRPECVEFKKRIAY